MSDGLGRGHPGSRFGEGKGRRCFSRQLSSISRFFVFNVCCQPSTRASLVRDALALRLLIAPGTVSLAVAPDIDLAPIAAGGASNTRSAADVTLTLAHNGKASIDRMIHFSIFYPLWL